MKPESAWEYELGLIQDFKATTLRAAVWYYDIQDFINDNGITAPGTGLGSGCLYNIDHFKLYGGELEAAVRLGPRLRATLAYVYQEYDVEENPVFEKEWTYYLPGLLPKHKVKLLARYNVWEDGWFQLSSRYVYKREAQKGTVLDDYITLDLGFEQTFRFQGMEYTASVFMGNVTGTDYQEQSGYFMPKYVWGFQIGARF
ncbi:TonB-dependent receptor (fragment) [uncultured Desulfatiglans sp.]|uniref:TonB-dependent receptor n=1 Tax=Uncultured Desulfatiglans sp. TaxID=1748965 RepID=A0A653A0G5_UNCDX